MKIRIPIILMFLFSFVFEGNTLAQSWDSLHNITQESFNQGNFKEALIYGEEALLQAEKEFGKTDSNYGFSLCDLGLIYAITGQHIKALSLLLKSQEILQNTIGKENQKYGFCLNNISAAYFYSGQYDKALSFSQEALINAEKYLGRDKPEYGNRLNDLAEIYRIMGRFENALPLFKEALEINEATLGKENPDYVISLGNMGNIYMDLGQYEKALHFNLEAYMYAEKFMGRNHPNYPTVLNNLAMTYQYLYQFKNAEPFFVMALKLQDSLLQKDNPNYCIALNNLALCYREMGEYEKAMLIYRESLDCTEKSLGKNHSNYAAILSNLAVCYKRMGQYDKSIPLFSESLEITIKSLGRDHPDYGKGLFNFASLYIGERQLENARPLIIESKNNIIRNIDRTFTVLSESEKEKYFKKVTDQFDFLKSFYLKYSLLNNSIAIEAFDIELATKGVILNSSIELRQNILISGDTIALRLYDKWKTAKIFLSKQYTKRIIKRDSTLIAVNEEKANDLESQLTRLSNTFKESKSLLSTRWQDIQKALGDKEVAIEFSSFNFYNGKKFTDSIMYVALVLRKNDSFPFMIPLCEQKQLDSLLDKAGFSDAEFISEMYNSTTSGKHLYNLVWKPLDSLLNKGDKIYFAPSGSLHQIAFSAIPYNSTALLSDRYTLTQLSSTAMLLRASKYKETLPPSMTIFGGIQYDVTDQELLALAEKDEKETSFVSRSLPEDLNRGNSWKYLEGTFTEAKAIDTIAHQNKINVSMYSGKQATEEAFKKLSGNNSPRVLHIASHGFFFPDPKKQNLNEFGDESQQVFRSSDNPLNRAGLLLAGANRVWKGDTLPANVEDGILTAYEVSNVSLNNTELVVLSACETGLGDIKGSEGVFGLQRAFKMAGAAYLLMSLWKVPDTETTELMTKFYSTWFSGKTIPEAFHQTQTYMKSKYPNDPYKWAAFVLVE